MTKKLTRAKVIRLFCLQCVGGVKAEVRRCTAKDTCPLYPYRLGRIDKNLLEVRSNGITTNRLKPKK